jgi:hypothetical protein
MKPSTFRYRLERAAVLSAKHLRHIFSKGQARTLLFVAGVQRSGTNMVMDILERSLDIDAFHERDERAFQGYEMRSPEVILELVEKARAPVIAIKALCESDKLQTLLETFPQSKVLWVFRHYDDVVNSQNVLWKGKADVIRRILQDHDPVGWRGRNISEETRAKLIAIYRGETDNKTASALFWYMRNIRFFEQEFESNPRVMLVRYEDLVTEPDRYFKAIFASLGLSYRSWQAAIASDDSIRSRAAPILDDRARILCEELYARFCAATLYIPR